jgi:acyl-CoA reductase-like NAD-dependent aldehyde dehydrogenase
MENYYLFVDGKNIDTGKYEYFPYSDMSILDFKKTYQIITELKKGKNPEDVDKYIYAKYCVGDNELNKKAIDAAYKASKIMRYVPVSKRKKIIKDIHKNLIENKENIIKLFAIEGHPKKLAQWEYESMEYALCENNLDLFKNNIFNQSKTVNGEKIYLVRKADGVVVLVPPKNASASNSISAAYCFLAGNSVIVKAPLKAPIATIFVWKNIIGKALKDNNAPDGVMNIITGNSKVIMDEWIENPKVNDIFFFGESENGLEISKRAHNNNKKAILELSGNDNMFVWNDCDIEGAVNSALDAFLGSTQICMLPKNIIIHEKVYEDFKSTFLEKVSKLEFGLPSNENTYFTPVVKMKQCQEFLEDALNKGAKLLCGGKRANYTGTPDEKGIYFQPTLLEIETDNPEIFNMKIVKEENFFPVIPLIKVKSFKRDKKESDKEIFDKMLEIAYKNEYGLRASVWVKSICYKKKFIKYIDNCAMLRINSRHIDFSFYLPAQGGVGKTGGPYGEASFLIQKITHLQGISLKK